MKSFYSHDLFYSYIIMQIIWLGLKESYHTTTTFFFFFFFFFNSSLSGFGNLSPISHQDLLFFLFRSLRYFVKHLRLAYFHKGYQFLYHSLNHYTSKTWERERITKRKSKKVGEFVKQNWILNNIQKTLYVLNKRKIVYI